MHLTTSNERRGAELSALAIAAAGSRFEHSVHAVHWTCPGAISAPVARLPRIEPGPALLGLLVPWLGPNLARLLSLIRRDRPAIVVAHGAATQRYAALASLFAARPIYVLKNITMDSFWVRSRRHAWLNRLLFTRFSGVVFESEVPRRDFQRLYGFDPPQATVIPGGRAVTPEPEPGLRETARAELGIPPEALALLWAGALTEDKNPHAALEVLARLVAWGVPARLVVAGAGSLEAELRRRAESVGLRGHTLLLGARSDLARIMAGADVHLHTSQVESMPGIVVEAGLAALPSVCFDVAAVGDIVSDGETGFLVAGEDVESMAERVRRLASDPELRRRMAHAARRRCVERFDIEPVVQRWEEYFSRLLQARSGGT